MTNPTAELHIFGAYSQMDVLQKIFFDLYHNNKLDDHQRNILLDILNDYLEEKLK